MWYIRPTEKWLNEVVRSMNEKQLKPEHSKFVIALFSSMDNEFVDYFKTNKNRISSFSGQTFHIFTPVIYDNNLIPDKDWRSMKHEFRDIGIPVETDPTFIFFELLRNDTNDFEPSFFAGYRTSSFKDFPNRLKNAINDCVEIKDISRLTRNLTDIFGSPNIIDNGKISSRFKDTFTEKLPKAKVFISHSSIDKPFAHKLMSAISADDEMNFWIDEQEILAGDNIQKSISQNLKSSDYLILLISENSVQSKWVSFEISQFMGFTDNKKIIPIILTKGQQFPEPIDNLIRNLKYLDFTDSNNWIKNVDELKQLLKK